MANLPGTGYLLDYVVNHTANINSSKISQIEKILKNIAVNEKGQFKEVAKAIPNISLTVLDDEMGPPPKVKATNDFRNWLGEEILGYYEMECSGEDTPCPSSGQQLADSITELGMQEFSDADVIPALMPNLNLPKATLAEIYNRLIKAIDNVEDDQRGLALLDDFLREIEDYKTSTDAEREEIVSVAAWVNYNNNKLYDFEVIANAVAEQLHSDLESDQTN